MFETIRRNPAERKAAEPWSLETTAMLALGEESVAEHSHRYAQASRKARQRPRVPVRPPPGTGRRRLPRPRPTTGGAHGRVRGGRRLDGPRPAARGSLRRPDPRGRLPVVRKAMESFDVAELAFDPPGWLPEAGAVAAEHGEQRVIAFPTASRKAMSAACSRFYSAVMADCSRTTPIRGSPGISRTPSFGTPRAAATSSRTARTHPRRSTRRSAPSSRTNGPSGGPPSPTRPSSHGPSPSAGVPYVPELRDTSKPLFYDEAGNAVYGPRGLVIALGAS